MRAGSNLGGGGHSTISEALTFRVKQEIFACVSVGKEFRSSEARLIFSNF